MARRHPCRRRRSVVGARLLARGAVGAVLPVRAGSEQRRPAQRSPQRAAREPLGFEPAPGRAPSVGSSTMSKARADFFMIGRSPANSDRDKAFGRRQYPSRTAPRTARRSPPAPHKPSSGGTMRGERSELAGDVHEREHVPRPRHREQRRAPVSRDSARAQSPPRNASPTSMTHINTKPTRAIPGQRGKAVPPPRQRSAARELLEARAPPDSAARAAAAARTAPRRSRSPFAGPLQ